MYEVDKNFPMPEEARKKGKSKYPVYTMEVGDSFSVPIEDAPKVRPVVMKLGKKVGREFSSRNMGDGTYRIWRIK